MFVIINDQRTRLPEGATISETVLHLGLVPEGLAVAVNFTVIPRDDWSRQILTENDTVTLIQPVQGG